MQDPQILAAGRRRAVLGTEDVVGHAKAGRRKQVVAIAVVGEGPGLAHQPVDDVAILDAMPALAAQAWNAFQMALGVIHVQVLGVEPHLYGFVA